MGSKPSRLSRCVRGICGMKRSSDGRCPGGTRRGYIPISVGTNDETKIFMVHTRAFYDAEFVELLWRSAEEYGFSNQGVLRIPCEANAFEQRMIVKKKAAKTNPISKISPRPAGYTY